MKLYDTSELPELLTAQEVNILLRMNWKNPCSCLSHLRQKGVLKGVRIEKRFLYPREEILPLMKGQR